MARSKTTMTQASLRLPDSLWKRAEQLAADMTAADPTTEYSRTDAIRRVLEGHLPPLRETSADSPNEADGDAPKLASGKAAAKKTAKR